MRNLGRLLMVVLMRLTASSASHRSAGARPTHLLRFWFVLCLMVISVGSDLYFDINAYLRYGAGRNILAGIETQLSFQFRYCNDHGILLYQDGGSGFFALGVNSHRIYLEWQTSSKIIELYIGDGTLIPNQTYAVVIAGLISRDRTVAFINSVQVPVNYLVTVDEALNVTLLTGDLYIGGYSDVSMLKVSTDRLIAYLVVCLTSIRTSAGSINFSLADQSVGVVNNCPSDFCASPMVVSVTSLQSFISMNLPLPPRTRTRISFSFKTKSSNGIIFYFGGPAYLLLYLARTGNLVLGLNTKGSGSGAFNYTQTTGYNDGQWHYIHVQRDGNMANLTNDNNQILTSVLFGNQGETAQTLNAAELMIGGIRNLSAVSFLPSDALVSLTGCYEAPRFIVYSITAEPAPLLNFDTQVKEERNISHSGCSPSLLCDPPCVTPSQVCNYSCVCAPGFFTVTPSPTVVCQNIDDCSPNPCLHGGSCTDLILDYSCTCPVEFKGRNCSIANNCYPSPCVNGATCTDLDNGYICSCAPGWTGTTCSSNIDECQSNPCQNGGRCQDLVGSFVCFCQPGYTGSLCDGNIDECLSLPCRNGGTCRDGVNSYTCICASGWQGSQCDVNVDECISRPCQNNGVCVDGVNQFSCSCAAGFTGSVCQTNIDECAFGFCQNNANCIDLVNNYYCSCLPGWTGKNCSDDILECTSLPCRNGGTCVELTNAFQCVCVQGYTGVLCELDINECLSFPCFNGGTCQDLVGAFTCYCPWAWTGQRCETDVNECLSNPCLNGATCNNLNGSFQCICAAGFNGLLCEVNLDDCASQPCLNGGTCVDGINSYTCACAAGFTSTRCEVNINECNSLPCQNSGTCIDGINSFFCICTIGYTGATCTQNIDECASTPCQNSATCIDGIAQFSCSCVVGYTGFLCQNNIDDCYGAVPHQCQNGATCIDGVNSYTCQCAPGWTGRLCDQDIDECVSSPCQNSGTCQNSVNRFSCLCPPTFTGTLCSDDVNECSSPQMPCRNFINCTNTYGGYLCQCQPGFTGINCESDINECASQPCYFNGTCIDLINGYRCICLSLYMGTRCEAVIRQCPLYHPCGDNAICVEIPTGGYTCYCKPGYEGTQCETKINPCRSNPCFNGGTCLLLNDGYNCSCIPGYTGPFCKVDVEECASQPCQNQGVCSEPQINMYSCRCQPGYSGTNCQDIINNCASSPCQSWQTCTNMINSYNCSCPAGYTGDRCEIPIDKCLSQPCRNGGTCQTLPSAFACICPYPWSGVYCETNTDICYPNPCLAYGTCVPDSQRPNGYRCLCVTGFIGDRCEGDTYRCLSNPCQNNGSCLEWTTGINGYDCICQDNFTGSNCQLDARTCQAVPCLNGATCSDLTTGYQCACLPGWTGSRCEQNIDECQILVPCTNGGVCIDLVNGYSCSCGPFWTGQNCNIDIRECLSNPCLNSGECSENIGAPYTCLCIRGYTGINCETRLSICLSQPCRNNGTCSDLVNQYTCLCYPGFTGVNCETPVPVCTNTMCQNGGTCVSSGGTLACQCVAGYAGAVCEQNVDECAVRPCLNGGTCIDGINSFTCTCATGFTGPNCAVDIRRCSSQPCLNGGTCVESQPNSYSCTCPFGVSGINCESVLFATFEGNNFVQVQQPPATRRRKREFNVGDSIANNLTSISFNFTTTVSDGIMIFALGADPRIETAFILFELYSGQLWMSAGLATSSVVLVLPLLSLGANTQVEMVISDGSMTLTMNPLTCMKGPDCQLASMVSDTSLMLNGPLYIGGVPTWTPYMRSKVKSTAGFTGCLGNVIVNGNYVNLAPLSQPTPGLQPPTKPQPGCSEHTPCEPGYCVNGGTCSDLWKEKTCACTSAFYGAHCELQLTASFTSDAMMDLPTGNDSSILTHIYFLISARSSYGTVLYTLDGFRFCLAIVNSQMELHLLIPNDTMLQTTVNVASGAWYRIDLLISNSSIVFIVVGSDIRPDVSRISFEENGTQAVGNIFAGKLHSHPSADIWRNVVLFPASIASFTGCLKNLTVNEASIDLSKAVPSGLGDDPPRPTAECSNEQLCSPNPCANRGSCSSSWDNYVCNCAGDNTGLSCSEVLAATFDGVRSYALLHIDTSLVPFGDSFAFDFRTRQPYSPLMVIQLFTNASIPSGSISFSLDGSNLQLTVRADSGQENSLNLPDSVSDGLWHSVRCQRQGRSFSVSIGNSSLNVLTALSIYTIDRDVTIVVSVGARATAAGASFFKGCLKGIRFNDETIPFIRTGPLPIGLTVDRVELKQGCSADDVCLNGTCPPNSLCRDIWNDYTCECIRGWGGTYCNESLITACDSEPCFNNGTCLLSPDRANFACRCPDTHMDRQCQTVNPCYQSKCQNNATCTPDSNNYTADGSSGNSTADGSSGNYTADNSSGNYTCQCQTGWYGSVCDLVDLCVSQPCGSGGSCQRLNDTYNCTCLSHFTGANCESVIDPCESNFCQHGGACFSNATLPGSNFTCFCPVGFTGQLCETDIDECASKPCLNNGTCIQSSSEAASSFQPGFRCQCSPGFDGTNCGILTNSCPNRPCLNGGSCQITANGYKCFCVVGWRGDFCEQDQRQGACLSQPCVNGATCEWVTESSYRCVCLASFTGSRCETNMNICNNNQCTNGATCIPLTRNYSCSCPAGFGGDFCQLLINSCGYSPPPCEHGGICSYQGWCSCKDVVYTCGFYNQSCQVNECAKRADCVSRPFSFSCNCTGTGYTGYQCLEDINECNTTTVTCQDNKLCENLPGSYRCACRQGYTGSKCEVDLNECDLDVNACLNSGRCINANGTYWCNCSEPWTGLRCELNNTCAGADNSSSCYCANPPCQAALASLSNESRTAIIVAIIVLCLLIVLAAIFIWYVRRSRRYRGNYKPSKFEEKTGTVPMSTFPPEPMTSISPSSRDDMII